MNQDKTGRIKVVVDTNTLVDAIFHEESNCVDIFKYKHDGEICFCMNQRTFQEAVTIFLRTLSEFQKRNKNIMKENRDKALFYKLSNALWEINKVNGKTRCDYCKEDPEDNKFIDCCIDGQIKYLVSSDHHLLGLKNSAEIKKHGIEIMTPREFSLELLRLKFDN